MEQDTKPDQGAIMTKRKRDDNRYYVDGEPYDLDELAAIDFLEKPKRGHAPRKRKPLPGTNFAAQINHERDLWQQAMLSAAGAVLLLSIAVLSVAWFQSDPTPAPSTSPGIVTEAPAQPDRAAQIAAARDEGNALRASGRDAEAVTAFTRLIELDPYTAAHYSLRGLAYLALDDMANARTDFDSAIAFDPNVDGYWYGRGFAAFYLDDLDAALADFNMTLQLNPRHHVAHVMRGQIYRRQNQLPLAIQEFTRAIDLAPGDPNTYLFRAYAYRDHDRLDRAIVDVEQYLSLAGDNAAGWASDMLAEWQAAR
jgi:tetratricopeptide (TPR) repeat protein